MGREIYFDGSTPSAATKKKIMENKKQRCEKELFIEKYFGIKDGDVDYNRDEVQDLKMADLVNILYMWDDSKFTSPTPEPVADNKTWTALFTDEQNWIDFLKWQSQQSEPVEKEDEEEYWQNKKVVFTGINAGEYIDKEDFIAFASHPSPKKELPQTPHKDKPFIVANVRDVLDSYDREEISYSRMVELLNEMVFQWQRSNGDITDLLERLEDYMEDKADADYQEEKYVPNKEMTLLVDIRKALAQNQRQQGTDAIGEWEKDLAEDAINAYFHEAIRNLERKDLGDIERRNWEGIQAKCKKILSP